MKRISEEVLLDLLENVEVQYLTRVMQEVYSLIKKEQGSVIKRYIRGAQHYKDLINKPDMEELNALYSIIDSWNHGISKADRYMIASIYYRYKADQEYLFNDDCDYRYNDF